MQRRTTTGSNTLGPPADKNRFLVRSLLAWFKSNARDLPWRRTLDPYAIWIAEIMLQQTQVKTVIPYWRRWMRELPTVRSLARARLEKVLKLWEGLGYYTRAANLQKAAKVIIDNHGSRFPGSFDDILALPGVGRYTAGAVCSIAFNQPTPILDGNVIRVLTRFFGISNDPGERITNARLWTLTEGLVWEAERLQKSIERNCSQFNQALMEIGATVCTPRRPKCPHCPVRRRCLAFREKRVEELPRLAQRPPPVRRLFVAFVTENRGRFLVRQRPAGVVNAHLWEFPNVEANDNHHSAGQIAREVIGPGSRSVEPLFQVKHSITRNRITLEVYRATSPVIRRSNSPAGRWLTLRELSELAFPSAHRKILSRLAEHPRH